MNIKMLIAAGVFSAAVTGFCAGGVPRSDNTDPSSPYDNSNVQAQLRLEIAKDTDEVHFIRDNNDPYVVTKTYVLKHADPYELRPYVRGAVEANRVAGDKTGVECIKYNDGTGILIVSAEEFRFKSNTNGMSIDDIVKALDQPKITSSSGQARFFYFPKYRSAKQLESMIFDVGVDHKDDPVELYQGKDKVFHDPGLNALYFYVAKYSRKNISAMLEQYDAPNPEIILTYKMYEIYAENDGKMGLDFQAWKNNDGADIFSIGGQYRNNWASTFAGGVEKTGSSKTSFINFSPKWNTKYLDFLTSKGKAKVVTKGQLAVRNEEVAQLSKVTKLFNYEFTPLENQTLDVTNTVYEGNISSTGVGNFSFTAYDSTNKKIGLSAPTGANAQMSVVKAKAPDSEQFVYYLKVKNTSSYFTKDGTQNCGNQVQAFSFSIDELGGGEVYTQNADKTIYKGNKVDTESNGYGFSISILPHICEDATKLEINITNDSLIGWKSNGSPRVARTSNIVTDVMISHEKNQFVIGGIEKKNVVRSVSGLPLLKDLPILGWLFSTESESTKRSQLVLVAECVAVKPDTPVVSKIKSQIGEVNHNVKNAGNTNEWGFQQYLIDGEL